MKRENRHSWFYFACAAFILLLAVLGNLPSAQKAYLTGNSKELYEQLRQLSRWKERKPPGSSFAIKSTRIVTPKGIRPGAILVGENGVIEDVVDMVAVPPKWGPILDYGRLLVMPGLIDIQTLDENIEEVHSTSQDGVTSRLIYISDETRDALLLNRKSILKESFHPDSLAGFFVNKECFEKAKWCANHSPDHSSSMAFDVCQSIPSFVEQLDVVLVSIYSLAKELNQLASKNKLHTPNMIRKMVSSTYQIPRVSSFQSLKKFCLSRPHSMPSFHSVCLYQIALEMNFTNLNAVDGDIESCMDYFWNDYDCFEKSNTKEGRNISRFSKNTYRLPIAWTVAELAGISLNSFHSMACIYPAKIFGLLRKGKLEKGYDADIVVWSPELNQSFPTDVCQKFEPLCQRTNHTLKGVVFETFVGGKRKIEILSE
ncbi:endodeoxyribonuclease isoform 2 [Galdieria sulphuraria]|uniref:Endodeoxyribonuclease isoform 2 n=1 Tax=Galdieria sulphuraria TaxID=130081 RepID=M2Y688_GALSU|nr:endodeoxyribonuclease isoform 2 [Galdieria sulphuraria]EME31354.1 endodeoxyribonuclease isoform 2 [Galdieria sulphuraria]|eukprot:XP_005707874.1 endodeoxyribonuclease isoform 2 [Galdieria sulphuraria]